MLDVDKSQDEMISELYRQMLNPLFSYAKAIMHNPGLAEEAVYAEHCHAEPVHIGLAPHVMLVSCIVKRRIAEDNHNIVRCRLHCF